MDIVTTLREQLTDYCPPDSSPYECNGCGMRFDRQYHVCPACGGYTIERTEWPRLPEC